MRSKWGFSWCHEDSKLYQWNWYFLIGFWQFDICVVNFFEKPSLLKVVYYGSKWEFGGTSNTMSFFVFVLLNICQQRSSAHCIDLEMTEVEEGEETNKQNSSNINSSRQMTSKFWSGLLFFDSNWMTKYSTIANHCTDENRQISCDTTTKRFCCWCANCQSKTNRFQQKLQQQQQQQ